MSLSATVIQDLYREATIDHAQVGGDDVARLVINHGEVVEAHGVDGIVLEVEEIADGVDISFTVEEGAVIAKPVHMCFGMLPEQGLQRIVMAVNVRRGARVSVQAHCVFPNAVDVVHAMDAVINIEAGGDYRYFERHVHGAGGIRVVPKARITVGENARFSTEFELIKGPVGVIDIDYEIEALAHSVVDMLARVRGQGDDIIKIREAARLSGAYARGVLTSKIALRDRARADILSEMVGAAAYARGHVDCKEIIQGQAVGRAVPIVEVCHPRAHITHEAAIGSVDTKQLETLMSRGLSEDEASDIIIAGLLS
jgi:Fe-S cluster assembly scaffold protein SufB